MPAGAGVVLVLDGGEIVVQRRDDKVLSSPNKLGIFGGHIKKGETAEAALRRELAEETSLDVDKLPLEHLFSTDIPGDKSGHLGMHISVFKSHIKNDGFKVYEGSGSEAYSFRDLMQRKDLDYYVKFVIDELSKDKYGFINN